MSPRVLFRLSNRGIATRSALLMMASWLPLLLLSWSAGQLVAGADIPFLKDVIPYVRCLLVIPLLVSMEAMIAPMLGNVMDYLSTSGLLTEQDRPRFERYRDSMYMRMNSAIASVALLAFAVLMAALMKADYVDMLEAKGLSSWAFSMQDGQAETTLAGLWYLYVSLPIASFMLYRWLWRFLAWCVFVYRVSRLELQLQATHSDMCGGLGIIGTAQNLYGILFLAMSMSTSAILANNILYEGTQVTDVKLFIISYLIISVLVINLPLLVFSSRLLKLKQQAVTQYGLLHFRSSKEFHAHWIEQENRNMVDSMHPSALADYMAVHEVVNSIRVLPYNPRAVTVMAVIILSPFLPLVFTQSSFQEVLLSIGSSMI